jgi:hypothetical protein
MVEGEISFGRFRLDLARRELRRDEKSVRLGSRALDILCVLVSAGVEKRRPIGTRRTPIRERRRPPKGACSSWRLNG